MGKTLGKFIILIFGIFILQGNILAQLNTNPEAAKIVTSDIELFWKAYDLAKPENNLNVFRDEYLKKGSPGLKDFVRSRIGNSCNLVGAVESAPQYYAALREPSLKIGKYENQIRASFRKMKELYPESIFPDVYFVIGRMNSAGTTSLNGLLIGVDMFGKNEGISLEGLSDWHQTVITSTERIPYIVAHELIHYQQKSSNNTLLGKSLKEGGADFIGELIAGNNINPHLHKYGNPIEKDLWEMFKKEMTGTNTDNWLYQGDNAKGKPADLGYYIGYKICESYYKKATDKKQAVKDILEIRDVVQFLADSQYEEKLNKNRLNFG